MSLPSLRVRNTSQAVNEVLFHLRRNGIWNIPDADAKWQEKTLYSTGIQDYAITGRLFISDEWLIEVYQAVAPLSRTIYQTAVFNAKLRRYWKGSVMADGSITETEAFKLLSEGESQTIAEELNRKIQIPAPKPGGYGH